MAISDVDTTEELHNNDNEVNNQDELQQTYLNIQPSGYLHPKCFDDNNYWISSDGNVAHLMTNGMSTVEGVSTNHSKSSSFSHSDENSENVCDAAINENKDCAEADDNGKGGDVKHSANGDEDRSSTQQRQSNEEQMKQNSVDTVPSTFQGFNGFRGVTQPLNSMQRYNIAAGFGYTGYATPMMFQPSTLYYSNTSQKSVELEGVNQKSVHSVVEEPCTAQAPKQLEYDKSVSCGAQVVQSNLAQPQQHYSSPPLHYYGTSPQMLSLEMSRLNMKSATMCTTSNGYPYYNISNGVNPTASAYNGSSFQGNQMPSHVGTRLYPYGFSSGYDNIPACGGIEQLGMMAPMGMYTNAAMPYRPMPYIPRPMVIRNSHDPRWVQRLQESQRPVYNGQVDDQNDHIVSNSSCGNKRVHSGEDSLDVMLPGSTSIACDSNVNTRSHSGAGRPKLNRKDYYCTKCNVRHTPQWRYFFHEPVCNACYMKLKKQFNLTSTTTRSNKRHRK